MYEESCSSSDGYSVISLGRRKFLVDYNYFGTFTEEGCSLLRESMLSSP
jgi:hypothetical protein